MEMTRMSFTSLVSELHLTHHRYCINGNGVEVLVSITATATGAAPAQYTGCHAHGDEQWVLLK